VAGLSTLVRHGRAGQRQHGVDIVGKNEAIWPVGIQCKRKSVWPVSVVTTHDLDKEVEKAKEFKLTLKSSIWFRPPPAISRGKSTLV
jgi:hypothetical protein